MNRFLTKAGAILGAAALTFTISACDAPSDDADADAGAKGFVGMYKTEDTKGNDMEITLMEDGNASGKRADEELSGTWKEDGDAAVITWGDGWTTKLAKDGDEYKKSTWEGAMEGDPTDTTDAEKVK